MGHVVAALGCIGTDGCSVSSKGGDGGTHVIAMLVILLPLWVMLLPCWVAHWIRCVFGVTRRVLPLLAMLKMVFDMFVSLSDGVTSWVPVPLSAGAVFGCGCRC